MVSWYLQEPTVTIIMKKDTAVAIIRMGKAADLMGKDIPADMAAAAADLMSLESPVPM